MGKTMIRVVLLIFLWMVGTNLVFAACYPGLDCPEDIPSDAPRPYNPPPAPPPTPPHPTPPQPTVYEDCSNPFATLYGNFYGALLGAQPNTVCTQPATHCCFEDGSTVPLVNPGSIRYGDLCYVQIQTFIGQMPVQGLGCRR